MTKKKPAPDYMIAQSALVKLGTTRLNLNNWEKNGLPATRSSTGRVTYDMRDVAEYLFKHHVRAGRMSNDENSEVGSALRQATLDRTLMQTEKMRKGQADYISAMIIEHCAELHTRLKTRFEGFRKILNGLSNKDKKKWIAETNKIEAAALKDVEERKQKEMK